MTLSLLMSPLFTALLPRDMVLDPPILHPGSGSSRSILGSNSLCVCALVVRHRLYALDNGFVTMSIELCRAVCPQGIPQPVFRADVDLGNRSCSSPGGGHY